MPFFTEIYRLSAFLQGEAYSASYDKYRFNVIDYQFKYLSDLIGDGRISGWELTDNKDLTLTLSSGIGIINGIVSRTFGPFDISLADDLNNYLYIKKIDNAVGSSNSYSDIDSIEYTDIIPPALVNNVVFTNETSSSLSISWSPNAETDLYQYVIWRSENNISYTKIGETQNTSFTDFGLSQNTIYYYKIQAQDQSGNALDLGAIPNVSDWTSKDLTAPSLPEFIKSFPQNESIQVTWGDVTIGTVGKYVITIQEINDSFQRIGDANTITVSDPNIRNYRIKNLSNTSNYWISFNSVSINNVASETKSWYDSPIDIYGPSSVDNLKVEFVEGENYQVVLNVTWNYNIDPYDIDPYDLDERFAIRLIENGEYISNPIIEKNQYNSIISIATFKSVDGGDAETNRNIKDRTTYVLEIKAIDSDGDLSSGSYLVFDTPSFTPPQPITDLDVTRLDSGYLYVSWDKSQSQYVTNNYIQWNRIKISTGEEEVFVSKTDINLATQYYLSINDLSLSYKYKAIVTVTNDYNLESTSVSYVFQFAGDEAEIVDFVPIEQANSYDGFIELRWDNTNSNIKYYKIWRAPNNYFLDPSDFTLLETVDNSNWRYRDYEIENDSVYIYIITAVNIWGVESTGPASGQVPSLITVAVGKTNQDLGPPTDLSIAQVGNSINLSWTNGLGPCDGYQILRSIGDKGAFVNIGSVDQSVLTYTDNDVLLKTDTYYYIVSKYRNEAFPVVSVSSEIPDNSIYLAKIVTESGSVSIEYTVTDLLDDVVLSETDRQVDAHKHTFDPVLNIDRRINLQNNIIIDDWETVDYRKYITTEDIDAATFYRVKINGNNTSLYYSVDTTNKYILFEEVLYSTDGSGVFTDIPVISLVLEGVEEVAGILPSSRIKSIYANQFNSGIIQQQQIPSMNHDGRIYEEIIPSSEQFDTNNDFTYNTKNNNVDFDSSIIFYDINELVHFDNYLIAATSNGVYISKDFGSIWENVFNPPDVPTKIYYSERWNRYFLITPTYVYASSYANSDNVDFVGKWARIPGTEAVKMIRDIAEDGDYFLYIATDLGVYRIDSTFAYDTCWDLFDKYDWSDFTAFDWFDFAAMCEVSGNINIFAWQQLPIMNQQSSDCFAIIYDDINDRMIVSNETNIFDSTDRGYSWNLISLYTNGNIIWDLYIYEELLFAVTDNRVFRYNLNSLYFEEIAELDINQSRKIKVFNDKLYITTDKGLLKSLESSDITTDNVVYFYYDLYESVINGIHPVVLALEIVDDNLFVGLEGKIYIKDYNGEWNLAYQSYNVTKIPSVYINDEYQYLGYFLDSRNIIVYTDTRQEYDAVLSVASLYEQYQTKYNGWARQKYNSYLNIYYNNVLYNDISPPTDLSNFVNNITDLIYPIYDDTNSNESTATDAETSLNEIRDEISERFTDGTLMEDPYDPYYTSEGLIASYYNALDYFMSQIYEDSRVIETQDNSGNVIEEEFSNPVLEVSDGSININIENGVITFSDLFLNKYDNINIDILGCTFANISTKTHKSWDNTIGTCNSGSAEGFSRIQQSNIIQVNTFNKDNYNVNLVDNYNSVFIKPNDYSWYDVINSDINYFKESKINNNTDDLCFISDVYINGDSVYVCGGSSLLKINAISYDIDYIDVISGNIKLVKSFMIVENTKYILTDYEIIYNEDGEWKSFDGIGLPNNLYNWCYNKNTFVVGSQDGIYTYDYTWSQVNALNMQEAFIYCPDIIFVVFSDRIYSSVDNIEYNQILTSKQIADAYTGNIDYGLENMVFNDIILFQGIMYVATNKGLYKGDGSFYTNKAKLELLYITGDENGSRNIECTSLMVNGNYLYVGLSNGNYYVFYNNTFTLHQTTLDVIQHIRVVGDSIWLFSNDSLYIVDEDMTIGLSKSVPV